MTKEMLQKLTLHAVKGTAPENYELTQVEQATLDGFKELASSYTEFMKNRYDIYEIIMKAADEVVPMRVISALGAFADVQRVGKNEKILYTVRKGSMRAKKFITAIGLSGVYESFRLDTDTFEIPTKALGSAIQVDFERYIRGIESINDLMSIITEGLTDAVYIEVQRALKASLTQVGRPTKNVVIEAGWDPTKMVGLQNTVRAYGSNAVIFAPPEFISAMGADIVYDLVSTGGASAIVGAIQPNDVMDLHYEGRITFFRGSAVVQIQQSFLDETNEETWIDPQIAYVMPAGSEKVVKVGLRGGVEMWDWVNKDRSMELMFQQEMGVVIMTFHNWGIYQNTAISQTMAQPYGI